MDADSRFADPHRRFRGHQLDPRYGRDVQSTLIDPPGAVIDLPFHGFDVGHQVGQLVGDCLIFDDRLAGHDAILGNGERDIKRGPRHAETIG